MDLTGTPPRDDTAPLEISVDKVVAATAGNVTETITLPALTVTMMLDVLIFNRAAMSLCIAAMRSSPKSATEPSITR